MSYKNILNKINKIEKAMKRLEMDGFEINKNELRQVIFSNKLYGEVDTLNYLEIHNQLNGLLNHLNRLEKIDEYYKWTKFRINSDKNIRLFLDAYVNDTLEVMKPLNMEIKEYSYDNFKKFAGKFYNLVYFLIKLEIGVNGESEIAKEMFNHSGHIYCLNELMVSDLNRTNLSSDDRQNLKDMLKEKQYDNFVYVIIKLIKEDRKIKKLINISDAEDDIMSLRSEKSNEETLREIGRLVKKKRK